MQGRSDQATHNGKKSLEDGRVQHRLAAMTLTRERILAPILAAVGALAWWMYVRRITSVATVSRFRQTMRSLSVLDVLRARLLNALARYDQAIDWCNRSLALAERELGVDDGWIASLHVERGKAHWLGAADRERALADVRAARDLHPAPDGGLAELDELLNDA